MTDIAAATATVLALVCDIQGVVDVDSANVHGSQDVVITITDNSWREEVLRRYEYARTSQLFGFGSFTGDTLATKWADLSWKLPTASTYGTPMQQWSERLMNDVFRREEVAWVAMGEEAQAQAIADQIASRRSQGDLDFGNCWTGPVSELTAEAQVLTDGLEAMRAEVLAASCELPGVIDVVTWFRPLRTSELGYFSYVTVTPSADEDAVIRQLEAVTGGEVAISRFFYPTLSAASRKVSEAPAIRYIRDTRLDGLGLDREDLARQDAALWAQMGELRQNEAIKAEIARQHSVGNTSFGNCWTGTWTVDDDGES